MPESPSLGILGFGEVGYYTAKGLKQAGYGDIYAYNNGQRNRPPYSEAFRSRADEIGVVLVDSLKELADRSRIILSVTSPATALDVAKQAAPHTGPQHLYADMNSCGPRQKIEVGKLFAAQGALFVDACLLASPFNDLHKGLTYISGPGADDYYDIFAPYGMNLEKIEGGKVGDAALLKMLRSIISKGTMSILWELTYAAYKCDIDLHKFERALGAFRGDFFAAAERTVGYGFVHAARRAEEARDMQETLRDFGVDGFLAEAYEKRLSWAAKWEPELRKRFDGRTPTAVEVVRAIDELEKSG